MTNNTCEWCNCEIRSYDQNNPVTSFHHKGKLIFLHALCKETFFSVNKTSMPETNYNLNYTPPSGYMNIGASGFKVPIDNHRVKSMTG